MIAVLAAASISVQPFRYERALHVRGSAPAELVPDGPMFAHARPGFADLRVVDARGAQVPWRPEAAPPPVHAASLPLLDGGRRGRAAVARVRAPRGVDRIVLQVPDAHFVGTATVYGSDDERSWTALATEEIYSVGGARPARSTAVPLPANDFRFLEVRATHVSRVDAVTVTRPARRTLHRLASTFRRGVVDVGYAKLPVDELRVTAATPRYDRFYAVFAHGTQVASGRLTPRTTRIPLNVRGRYLRLVIDDGDDPPLRGLRVTAWAERRSLLLENGHPGPFAVYYGADLGPPSYDWSRLAAPPGRTRAALGPERGNPAYAIVDTRSLLARHGALVTAALALGCALVLAAGTVALRRT